MLVRTSVVTVYDLSDVRSVFVSCVCDVRFRFRDGCACVRSGGVYSKMYMCYMGAIAQ